MAIKLLPEEVPAVRKWLNDRDWDIICPWNGVHPDFCRFPAKCARLFPLTKTNPMCPCAIYGTAYVVKRVRQWLREAEENDQTTT